MKSLRLLIVIVDRGALRHQAGSLARQTTGQDLIDECLIESEVWSSGHLPILLPYSP